MYSRSRSRSAKKSGRVVAPSTGGVDRDRVPSSDEGFVKVELQKGAAELLVVSSLEALAQVGVVGVLDVIQPLLHQRPWVLPVVGRDPVQELDARLLMTAGVRSMPSTSSNSGSRSIPTPGRVPVTAKQSTGSH